jgi:hypothetical protein
MEIFWNEIEKVWMNKEEIEKYFNNRLERLSPEDVNNPLNCDAAKSYFRSKLCNSPMPNINISDSLNSTNK